MVDAPTPSPPMNLKKANTQGSVATAEPTAETKYNTPIQKRVFLRPSLSVGMPPKMAPITVPQSAEAMTTKPWKSSPFGHKACKERSAPEITTVSKPKRKPASATVIDQKKILRWFMYSVFCTAKLFWHKTDELNDYTK